MGERRAENPRKKLTINKELILCHPLGGEFRAGVNYLKLVLCTNIQLEASPHQEGIKKSANTPTLC